MLLGLFTALFSSIALLRHGSRLWTVLAIVVVGLAEVFGIRRLFKHDDQMCERLGFMCPHCHKPLYEPRSFINVNGKCPKCGRSIVNKTYRMVESLSCPKCSALLASTDQGLRCLKCGWDREIEKKRLNTLYRIYGVAVLLIFIITAFVELSAPPRFAAAILVLSFLVAIGGWEWVSRLGNALKVTQPADPVNWEVWLRLPRPRTVRIKEEVKLATVRFLMLIGIFVGLSILSVLLLVELHAYSPKSLRLLVLGGTVPSFAGALGLLASLVFSYKKSRRLVTNGEVTIGTIAERRRSRVTYEFKDGSDRLVSASCTDPSGSFDPGMSIPVFFNPGDPHKDQIALCGSPYEVAGAIANDHRG
jgi:hypothetical protein